jgi:hypothetical protein
VKNRARRIPYFFDGYPHRAGYLFAALSIAAETCALAYREGLNLSHSRPRSPRSCGNDRIALLLRLRS